MIKLGDKAKGFKFPAFRNSANLNYNEQMDRFVGVEGVVHHVGLLTLDIFFGNIWYTYPIKEYLAIQRAERAERLKELGI